MNPEFPSTTELAHLSAILSQGRGVSDSSQLARDALMLWQACQKHLVVMAEAAGKQKRCAADLGEAIAQLPKPKKFPATFEESLSACLKKQKEAMFKRVGGA